MVLKKNLKNPCLRNETNTKLTKEVIRTTVIKLTLPTREKICKNDSSILYKFYP